MHKMKVEESVIINIPSGEIFTYMCDLENLTHWSSAVISASIIASEDMLVGTMFRCTIRILGKWFNATYEIVECVPSRYLTVKSTTSVAPTLISYRFEPEEGGGTNVSVEENIQFTGDYLGVTEPVITSLIRRQLMYDLHTLKDLLESRSSMYSSTG